MYISSALSFSTTFVKNRKPVRASFPPWASWEFTQMVNRKNSWYKTVLRYPENEQARVENKRISNLVESLSRKLKENYLERAEASDKPKEKWKAIHLLLHRENKSTNIELLTVNNTPLSNIQAIANSLNSHFVNVASFQNQRAIVDTFSSFGAATFCDFPEVTQFEVNEIIHALPNKKGINDDVPIRIFKSCSDLLLTPITIIFNFSLKEGVVPDVLKTAIVIPIFKDGDRKNPDNYRPIALLKTFGKLLEKVVIE